ncbi:hypothetical protein Avbf_13682, partial [Armadillidium vulgare]
DVTGNGSTGLARNRSWVKKKKFFFSFSSPVLYTRFTVNTCTHINLCGVCVCNTIIMNYQIKKIILFMKMDREPGKRKVKPSKSALIDLAELDLGESSDDSDFNVDEAKLKEDDDISMNSDPDDDEDDDDDEEDENDEEDSTDQETVTNSTSATVQSNSKSNVTIGELLARAEEKQALAAE